MWKAPLTIEGSGLGIQDLIDVSRNRRPVRLSSSPVVLAGIEASRRRIGQAIGEGRPLYGVNTGFGGMGDVPIPAEDAAELQHNLIRFLKAGSGERLPVPEVRSAMLLLANALARGVSGIRPELIERLAVFLNEDVTPHVPALGSIGASGDLIPLAAIAGALIGLDDAFLVEHGGESLPSPKLLERLSLRPLALEAKEGLALVNGTAVLTGMAAGCVHDAQVVLAVSLGIHALAIQGLNASDGPFDPFIHRHKPHPGQIFAAARMRELLAGSKLLHRAETWPPGHTGRLIQDRYSVRCLPQFLGPVLDAVAVIADQVATEMNSTTDNPLIDGESGATFHGGNFLGQYIGVGMDQLRYFLGLVVKHLDAQIALLVEPAFNSGLPASLVGNPSRRVNMGLKGLQIGANSIMPLILHLGNPLVPHFPTHAEQFNQNINSQGFGSANLARQSLDLSRRYLAHALIFGVQAVSLRARLLSDNGDARSFLSPETLPLHETVRDLVGRRCDPQKPLVFDDHEQALDAWLSVLTADLAGGGRLEQAVAPVLAQIRAHAIDPVRVDSGVVPGRSSPTHGEGPP